MPPQTVNHNRCCIVCPSSQVMLFFYMIILLLIFVIQFSVACACLGVDEKKELQLAEAVRTKSFHPCVMSHGVI